MRRYSGRDDTPFRRSPRRRHSERRARNLGGGSSPRPRFLAVFAARNDKPCHRLLTGACAVTPLGMTRRSGDPLAVVIPSVERGIWAGALLPHPDSSPSSRLGMTNRVIASSPAHAPLLRSG